MRILYVWWRSRCTICKKRLKVFCQDLNEDLPDFKKISNLLHMYFQCVEEMMYHRQKEIENVFLGPDLNQVLP
jgi:hypothetical protein